jgi:hypothetical protein
MDRELRNLHKMYVSQFSLDGIFSEVTNYKFFELFGSP